jgi:glycosyltransferase involved in cell wall biosynthesis
MNDFARPLISIIIPTRERAETLFFTIQTALNQTSDGYEVVISDNFSQDNTREVVDSFGDPRLMYFNTGRRLSMSDNWEFALQKARGEYVIYIGDDDAVMPGAIKRLEVLIHEYQSDMYMWEPPIYLWPIDDRKAAIAYLPAVQPVHEMNLQKMASFVIAQGGWRYYRIPGTYHAAASMKILDMIRRKTGRVFHTTQPDIFTSMATPVFAKTCVNTGMAITMHGSSAKSNGAAYIARNGIAVQSKFIREYENYQIHPTLFPGASVSSRLMGDACLVAMDKFPEFYGSMKFNYEAMWAYMWQLGHVSFWEIVKNELGRRPVHPFGMIRLLFYIAFQSAVIVRRRMVNALAGRDQSKLSMPDNIRDFANVLHEFQKGRT